MFTKPSPESSSLEITTAGSRLFSMAFLPGVSSRRIWSNSVSDSDDSITNVFFLPLLTGSSSPELTSPPVNSLPFLLLLDFDLPFGSCTRGFFLPLAASQVFEFSSLEPEAKFFFFSVAAAGVLAMAYRKVLTLKIY